MTIKLDPGSQTTGIALIQGKKVVWGAELTHRGQGIKASLESRRSLRRNRRNRKTRYRQSGSFDIATQNGRITGISHKYCRSIHKKDGYSYGFQKH